MSFDFSEVRTAVKDAIITKNYDAIDAIIDHEIVVLTRLSHSRTPIFDAVDEVLGTTLHLPKTEKPHVTGMIVAGLSYIFDKVDQKLASGGKSDKELLKQFIDQSCNHLSHTSLLPSGATVRDLLEAYTKVDYRKCPYDKAYIDVYKLVNRYGLETKKEVAQENIIDKASHGKGR
jgi:hypothetical protein